MTTTTATRPIDRIIFWGVPLLGGAIILAFSLISLNMLSIKSALLLSGVTVLFAAWLVKTAGRTSAGLSKPLIRSITPALVFMVSALFSFLFISASKDTSLDELLLRIPYFLIFFIGAVAFSSPDYIRKAIAAILQFSFVAALYGLLQHFGMDPLRMGDHLRIQSTFGNPNFYVGFLTLVIPLAAAAFDLTNAEERKKGFLVIVPVILVSLGYYLVTLFSESRVWNAAIFGLLLAAIIAFCLRLRLGGKTFSVVTLFFLITNILLTGSRSGQIGLGAGMLLFSAAVFFLILPKTPARKPLLIILAAVSITGLVIAGVLHISFSDEGRYNTVLERKYYVEGALNLIGQKPVFGHGIGTFKNNYPLIKKPESWAYNATCFEHVSNVYNEHLEILHDEGIIGLAIWIWLVGVVFVSAYKALRILARQSTAPPVEKPNSRRFLLDNWYSPSPLVLLIGCISGTAALLIGNIFSLSMRYASTGYFFWLFMGFIVALSATVLNNRKPSAVQSNAVPTGKKALVLLFDGTVILIAAVTSILSFRFFLADIYLNEAVYYSKEAYTPVATDAEVFHDIFIEGTQYRSDSLLWEKALTRYRKSLIYNPYNLRARYFYGNAFNRRWHRVPMCNPAWGDLPGQYRTDLERAMEQYNYIIRQAPHYTEIDFELGDLYMKTGTIDKAIVAYRDYKRYKPFFTKIHYTLATSYAIKQEWALAAESYKDALDLNQKFTRGYLELSAVYRKLGKDELAKDMFERAREVSPDKVHLLMADVWKWLREPEKEIQSLYNRIAEDSTDALPYARLGWHFIQTKEWQKAIEMYEKTVTYNPRHTSAWVNLSNLYFEDNRIDEAKEAFDKAMSIDSLYVQSIIRGKR